MAVVSIALGMASLAAGTATTYVLAMRSASAKRTMRGENLRDGDLAPIRVRHDDLF